MSVSSEIMAFLLLIVTLYFFFFSSEEDAFTNLDGLIIRIALALDEDDSCELGGVSFFSAANRSRRHLNINMCVHIPRNCFKQDICRTASMRIASD